VETIRSLGYLKKNSLKNWLREYERYLDLPVGGAGAKPKHLQVQKNLAVEHELNHGRRIAATHEGPWLSGMGCLDSRTASGGKEARCWQI